MTARMTIERTHGTPLKGILSYESKDHAFAFRPLDPVGLSETLAEGRASLAFGTIQLEVAVADGLCLFAWGYSPRQGWIQADLSVLPPRKRGACKVVGELDDGLSKQLFDANSQVLFDRSRHQTAVILGGGTPEWSVEVADGVSVLGTGQGLIAGLILEPVIESRRPPADA